MNDVIDVIGYKTIELQLAGNSIITEYTFPSGDITFKGTQPTGGTAKVNKDEKIQIAVYDDSY